MEKQKPIICWQEGTKLRWGDFQSKTHPWGAEYALSTKYGACVSPEITLTPYKDEKGINTFNVKCFFKKKESWVRDSVFVMEAVLLAHEQFHFDICELIGRKLRKRIAQECSLGHNVFSSDFGQEINCMLSEEDALDALYDQETNHGTIASEQQRWANLIKQELAALETFKSTIINCR